MVLGSRFTPSSAQRVHIVHFSFIRIKRSVRPPKRGPRTKSVNTRTTFTFFRYLRSTVSPYYVSSPPSLSGHGSKGRQGKADREKSDTELCYMCQAQGQDEGYLSHYAQRAETTGGIVFPIVALYELSSARFSSTMFDL